MFRDRKDAGQRLATELGKYKDKDVVVLGIPRGGALVGLEVAKYLNAQFSLIVSRKLPFPDNPESGFGAIAEDGSVFTIEEYMRYLSEETVKKIIDEQKREVQRRIKLLRDDKPLPDITGKTVIIVDDGIAMGSTMRASIMLCRNKNADKVVVASPVSGPRTVKEMNELADEIIILETPRDFSAVAEVYEDWYDVPDEEVIEIMKDWAKPHQ